MMQSTKTITCPACGRPNQNSLQCAFCGANLQESASPPEDSGVRGALRQPEGPASPETVGTGAPPPLPGPPGHREGSPLAPKFAGFWIRTVAYVIDGFLIQMIYAVLLGVGLLGYTSGSDADVFSDFSRLLFETNFSLLNLLSTVIYLAYFTFFLGTRGQTPGKMLCGLRVIRVDGSSVSYGQAAVRTVGYYLNLFTLCLGFLWVAFDPRKQGLHDKIAGTYEIRIGLAEVSNWKPPPQA